VKEITLAVIWKKQITGHGSFQRIAIISAARTLFALVYFSIDNYVLWHKNCAGEHSVTALRFALRPWTFLGVC